jgi:hypothetical protein
MNLNRELLEKEFEKDQIKTRRGNYGKDIDYVETAAVIQRLNNAIDGDWSFEVVEHIIQDNDIAVLGKLSTNGVVKMQWGSRKIKKNSKTGEIICLGDDLKSAASDSLKKAASLLGCGLHLYTDDELEPLVPVTNKSEEKITQEQLAQIKKLRTDLGWNADKVVEQAQKLFQTDVLELNPTMAQTFIAFLQTQLNSKQLKQEEKQKASAPPEEPPF